MESSKFENPQELAGVFFKLSQVEHSRVPDGLVEAWDDQCGFFTTTKLKNVTEVVPGGLTVQASQIVSYSPAIGGGLVLRTQDGTQTHVAESVQELDRAITAQGGRIVKVGPATLSPSERRFQPA